MILPLDFDCWFYLALSYILVKDVENALLVINSLPIIINKNKGTHDLPDLFVSTFIERLELEEVISEKLFYEYFPNPKIPMASLLLLFGKCGMIHSYLILCLGILLWDNIFLSRHWSTVLLLKLHRWILFLLKHVHQTQLKCLCIPVSRF